MRQVLLKFHYITFPSFPFSCFSVCKIEILEGVDFWVKLIVSFHFKAPTRDHSANPVVVVEVPVVDIEVRPVIKVSKPQLK